ncbi:aquaporin-like protein [Pseudoneurospora amorphoporcata]|uniref:Aquaporin-like protein n=1 Tax=Pseudoneurospora amorphoporcata TaxID=241081 RepID=A0AAN6NV76_9PEZI|nr:aquaporin-like protein [Pseudoneurospora amorphoporcata]
MGAHAPVSSTTVSVVEINKTPLVASSNPPPRSQQPTFLPSSPSSSPLPSPLSEKAGLAGGPSHPVSVSVAPTKYTLSHSHSHPSSASTDVGRRCRRGIMAPFANMSHPMRTNLVFGIGEFVGTFLFLFFAFAATQVANTAPANAGGLPSTSNLLYIALAFGFSLMVNVWAFFRVTGGAFNPAVTLALVLVGGFPVVRAAIVMVAQILGATAAAGLVQVIFPGPLAVETTLGGGATAVQGFFIEVFLTCELVFVILMMAVEKHSATASAPVAIGLALFLSHLVGIYFTGASLNPARSIGPAIVNRHFPRHHWIYWLGPALGALLACGFYKLLHVLKYNDVNPGADDFGQADLEAGARDGDQDGLKHSPTATRPSANGETAALNNQPAQVPREL